ncbi:MAG: hypothetical protein Q8L37_03735 [Candidatus Gottesmanbacteria bacterium]|nr:hypothetical protein [Candidatus Gottesmanbacteria bacterium]
MIQPESGIIREPHIHFHDVTKELVDQCDAREAEKIVVGLIAERARVKEGGIILSWSEFNENPDPLVNRLLAKILVAQIDPKFLEGVTAAEIAVLSIENSAGYLASEVTHELARQLKLSKPPRIIRARKAEGGKKPSPAMGGHTAWVDVHPITSGGQPRTLVASMADTDDLKNIKVLIPVDDFRATGSSLNGGVNLGLGLLEQAGVDISTILVLPMAGLGKPEQERAIHSSNHRAFTVMTAVNVHFWADRDLGHALVQANGFPPHIMHNASVADFSS